MSNINLGLCWSQFEANALYYIQQLWNDQSLADVTLATKDDQSIRVHKIILGSGSSFFRDIFSRYSHQNPFIYLKDIQYVDLEKIIEFIYTGQCDVGQTQLEQFISTGN